MVLTNEEITGPAAREMVRLADIDERSVVLDNATGGGVVAIASKAKYAVDIDDSMLSLARSRGLQLVWNILLIQGRRHTRRDLASFKT